MDYPDVTFVLQVGMTTREQYTHRLGRTARAGKGGSGMLLLQPFEESSMRKELKGFDLILKSGESLGVHQVAEEVSAALDKVSLNDTLKQSAEKAYKGRAICFFSKSFIILKTHIPGQPSSLLSFFTFIL